MKDDEAVPVFRSYTEDKWAGRDRMTISQKLIVFKMLALEKEPVFCYLKLNGKWEQESCVLKSWGRDDIIVAIRRNGEEFSFHVDEWDNTSW